VLQEFGKIFTSVALLKKCMLKNNELHAKTQHFGRVFRQFGGNPSATKCDAWHSFCV